MARYKVPTKVLSMRVPEPVYNEIQSIVDSRHISLSDWVQERVGKDVDIKKYLRKPALSNVDTEYLQTLTPILGGAGIGTGLYFLIKQYIKEKHPEKDAEAIALMASLAVGLGSVMLINLAINKSK